VPFQTQRLIGWILPTRRDQQGPRIRLVHHLHARVVEGRVWEHQLLPGANVMEPLLQYWYAYSLCTPRKVRFSFRGRGLQ
jgi:hypothetical protein